MRLRKKLLGESHHDVALSLNNLAYFYGDQRRYKEAKPLYLQALKVAKVALGENHPRTNLYRNNLQQLLEKMKNQE